MGASSLREQIRAFRRWLHSHPAPRTAGNVLTTIFGSILGAWFILDISSSGELILKDALDTWATLGLVIYAGIVYVYYLSLFRFERDLYRWNEPSYKAARLTEELLPELISAYRKRIQTGESTSLEQIKKDILG